MIALTWRNERVYPHLLPSNTTCVLVVDKFRTVGESAYHACHCYVVSIRRERECPELAYYSVPR